MLESHRSALLSATGQLEKLQRARSLAFTNLGDRKSLEFARARPVRPSSCIYHESDADCPRVYTAARGRLTFLRKRSSRVDSLVSAVVGRFCSAATRPPDFRSGSSAGIGTGLAIVRF